MSEQAAGPSLRAFGVKEMATRAVTLHGVELPEWFRAYFKRDDIPYTILIHIRVHPENGLIPVGVQVVGRPDDVVTYRDAVGVLKGESIDRLMGEALTMAIGAWSWQQGLDELGKSEGHDLTDADMAELGRRVEQATARTETMPPTIRRRIVTRDLLKEVAGVYRAALEANEPPTKSVADHFHTTHSSAARWVREARKVGELGPSRGPIAGEEGVTASE